MGTETAMFPSLFHQLQSPSISPYITTSSPSSSPPIQSLSEINIKIRFFPQTVYKLLRLWRENSFEEKAACLRHPQNRTVNNVGGGVTKLETCCTKLHKMSTKLLHKFWCENLLWRDCMCLAPKTEFWITGRKAQYTISDLSYKIVQNMYKSTAQQLKSWRENSLEGKLACLRYSQIRIANNEGGETG